MQRHTATLICGIVIAAVMPMLAATPLEIRLGTFAPARSEWHTALLDMGHAWATATDGRVKLIVYPGGTQGSEPTVVKMMRPGVDQLQAALLLPPGLATIDDAFNVFGIPFFFESDAEMRHVLQAVTPMLARRLEVKGFHLVNWGHAGWVQIFSKKPIETLEDLKRARLYTTEGDDRAVEWYKSNGFNPRALSFNDIPAQLRLPTGMIDTAPSPPYGALSLGIFRSAPYMLELRVAPLISGTVITAAAWQKISPMDRERMLEAARTMEARVMRRAPELDAESIAAMEKRGLKVVKVAPAAATDFRATAGKLTATMRGRMVPEEVFDLALEARNAFRAKGPR